MHALTQTSQSFMNRHQAGQALARILPKKLTRFRDAADVVVMAMPKGGVAVGAEIAAALHVPLDVLLVAKITMPGCGSTPLGAITSGGVRMLNDALIDNLHLNEDDVNAAVLKESQHIALQEKIYRGGHPSLDVADRTVILADDGTTPCSTLRCAIRLLRREHADHVVVALPALCRHSACDLRYEADDVVTLAEPSSPAPPSRWFHDFPPTSEREVRELLERQFVMG